MTATKDSLPDFHSVENVEYVPVPAMNQAQPQSVNNILQALGGVYTLPKDGDKVSEIEGWVPPGNRDGENDPVLARDKAYRLHKIDTTSEEGIFPRIVDPRDNNDAPDEWPSNAGEDTKRDALLKAAEKAQNERDKRAEGK